MKKLVVVFAALALGIAAHAQTGKETWVTLKSVGISFQVTPDMPTAGKFQTNVLRDLPGSDIIDGAQSVKIQIWGDCRTRTYQIMGMLPYSGKMGSGTPDAEHATDPEGVVHRVEDGSLIEHVFTVACK